MDEGAVKEQTEFIDFKIQRFVNQYVTEIAIAAQE